MEWLKNVEAAYQSGMREALKELAISKLLENPDIGADSPIVKKAEEEAYRTFDAMKALLQTEEQIQKLLDTESAFVHAGTCLADEHFIHGFISGYEFLKALQKSYRPAA